jgi:hypothetical protein
LETGRFGTVPLFLSSYFTGFNPGVFEIMGASSSFLQNLHLDFEFSSARHCYEITVFFFPLGAVKGRTFGTRHAAIT